MKGRCRLPWGLKSGASPSHLVNELCPSHNYPKKTQTKQNPGEAPVTYHEHSKMSSPQHVSSPSPMLAGGQHRQNAAYDPKTSTGAYVNPDYTKKAHTHAHPTAYYVFDMVFKLVSACALIGILAIMAVNMNESKKTGERTNKLINDLDIRLSSVISALNAMGSTFLDISAYIRNIYVTMDNAS